MVGRNSHISTLRYPEVLSRGNLMYNSRGQFGDAAT